jgi:hypothetical protein
MRRTFVAGLLGIALAACATESQTTAQRYYGVWDWHFETSAFTTDGGEGPYWLVAEGAAWEQINAPLQQVGRGPWGRVHLIVEGYLGPRGRHGHLGAYAHELHVTRVIEARLISADGQPSGN